MSGNHVETEALGQAAIALGQYISSVQENINKMKDAAIDCSDNMGSDVYSQKAIEQLSMCTRQMSKTIEEARVLQEKILRKKQQIEESGRF